jgi:TatD DNase family protein
MQLIDIGVNLMDPSFDRDREEALARAVEAGVSALIITGSSLAGSEAALGFAQAHIPACWASAGVHPHNAKTWDSGASSARADASANAAVSANAGVSRLRDLAAHPACAALGECGLDYNRNFSPPAIQRRCFEEQLALAAELGKPVFLHERDAFADFSAILKKYRPALAGAVVHCFTGGMRELETYLAMDCHIGITGWICDERRGRGLIPLLRHIPPDRLLMETDAPYLIPRSLPRGPAGPHKGRNEPGFLPHIAACIAGALGKDAEQVAAETRANAIRLFRIGR